MPVTPGCNRRTIDFPQELDKRLVIRAEMPPAISVSEYVRRLVAHHLNYNLPPADERTRRKLRLDGNKKERPGPERQSK